MGNKNAEAQPEGTGQSCSDFCKNLCCRDFYARPPVIKGIKPPQPIQLAAPGTASVLHPIGRGTEPQFAGSSTLPGQPPIYIPNNLTNKPQYDLPPTLGYSQARNPDPILIDARVQNSRVIVQNSMAVPIQASASNIPQDPKVPMGLSMY